MLLEALLDDRQHSLVDQARDGVLHHALVFASETAAHVEQIHGIEGISHGGQWLSLLEANDAA